MKKIMKNACILAALMILAVFTISTIWSGITEDIALVFELFGLAFVISVADHMFDEYSTLSPVTEYIVRYFAITFIVMLFGFIAGWFYRSNFWMAFIYVGAVHVLSYLIDAFRIKRDIEYINTRISGRTGLF